MHNNIFFDCVRLVNLVRLLHGYGDLNFHGNFNRMGNLDSSVLDNFAWHFNSLLLLHRERLFDLERLLVLDRYMNLLLYFYQVKGSVGEEDIGGRSARADWLATGTIFATIAIASQTEAITLSIHVREV